MSFCIIVPIKNQFRVVKTCVDSIIRHHESEEVILVDDGSTEVEVIEFLKKIKDQFRHWKVIFLESSLGHTEVCSLAIKQAESDNIFLLNSDTIVTRNCLKKLNLILEENEKIAVVGPMTSSASGIQLIKEMYDKRFQVSIEEIEKFAAELEVNKCIEDIELVNGFCFGIKKNVFNEVNGFDVSLKDYGNEKELLIRIRKLGYRTVCVKGCYTHHFGKMSYSKENINIGLAQKNADVYIAKKHWS